MSCYNYLHCRGNTKVSYYILLRENQKYYIISRSSKLSENIFLAAFVMMKLQQQWDALSQANKMFLNGNAIADEASRLTFINFEPNHFSHISTKGRSIGRN